MTRETKSIEPVRASRDGHAFHERWTARRALQLIFPKDDLFAIAVEGLSTNETASLCEEAEDIADLILYFGEGDTFVTCSALQTLQFKYKVGMVPVTSSYLKKTIQKFASTVLGYEKIYEQIDVCEKLTFSFVTNTDFSEHLWEAIRCLQSGAIPEKEIVQTQYDNLKTWCEEKGITAERLFPMIEFKASTIGLSTQNHKLHKTISDLTPGVDSQARMRLQGLEALVREKAGMSGQHNNLIKREDVLDSLGCEVEDLFPANTAFVDVGPVIKRKALVEVSEIIKSANLPVFLHADGGVGKTVFIQSIAQQMDSTFEIVIFDCFGGGSYRALDQSRHLPKVGLLQIVNELASRGLCDPQLPSDGDRYALIKAARKRLGQAAETVKNQSKKSGVLVIIDAADNAELEANHRREDAFPRLLLASLSREPLDGVKLLLTARPHRMEAVVEKSLVERFELGVFSLEETHSFLESRRSEITELEFTTAQARSAGNARVLDYLVASWDQNISNSGSKDEITVEELIRQRCDKIKNDLHFQGWGDDEVNQFFVAISLLPPPIPLNEMAVALGWTQSKINSAISDLAPMLELLKHGVIFRDEPTETFIRETYALETKAQQEIAERLFESQAISGYAAEALPHFLVVINDTQRAYELSISEKYPSYIQSEYGRRRLKLLRLNAAFSLAVKAKDYDRVLVYTMQLAQVASANAKGDDFIRCLPGISVCLGDPDVSRRLFNDRAGWRGARDARLVVSFAFQKEMEEADIYVNRVIGWINWHSSNKKEEQNDAPTVSDYASVLFLSVLKGDYAKADSNLVRWGSRFALSVCSKVISLLWQYQQLHQIHVLDGLAKFASSKDCLSLALQISLLSSQRLLSNDNLMRISRATSTRAKNAASNSIDNSYDQKNSQQNFFCNAALSSLIHGSRQSSANIMRAIKSKHITRYNYNETYGSFYAWPPILSACINAWSSGKKLCLHHLLPQEIQITKVVKNLIKRTDLSKYLAELIKTPTDEIGSTKDKKEPERLFSSNDCENITKGIELIKSLAEPLQQSIFQHRGIDEKDFHEFIQLWKSKLPSTYHYGYGQDFLCVNVGLGFSRLFLQHAKFISVDDCDVLIEILGQRYFKISDKLDVLFLMAKHENLKEKTGAFARMISEDIRKDEYIKQRADHYSKLSEALLPLSTTEAQHYFREGLSQLDQMGSDDYDIIYSILQYASEQRGGWLQPALGHRLMNLCQTICQDEPSKFGWTLFAKAASQSIGYQAVYKLIRWSDQDVSNYSYGLPQLISYLANSGHMDARRAAFILSLCEDQGWYDWKIGDGLNDILEVADESDRSAIFQTFFSKLKLENPLGGSEYLWKSILETIKKYPCVADENTVSTLESLCNNARIEIKEEEKRQKDSTHYELNSEPVFDQREREVDDLFKQIVNECDIKLPHTVDSAIHVVRSDQRFKFNAAKSLIEQLREKCAYDSRSEFIYMLAELTELDFDHTIDAIVDCVERWSHSSAHIFSGRKDFIRKLFEERGSGFFDFRYKGILSEMRRLISFCGDENFVLELVFDTISKEKIELTGNGWFQLATSLCPYTSSEANLRALSELLSGPAAKIGDEFGEGIFKPVFSPTEQQRSMIAGITWHLLGNAKNFVRWTTARNIKSLADLGLYDDIEALLDCFDRKDVAALLSENMDYSFLNARQWLLMGLSRTSFYKGETLKFLRCKLEKLANRDDIHVVNKIHILRCLKNISGSSALPGLYDEPNYQIYTPKKGYVSEDNWPDPVDSKTAFHFDYEFNKHEVPSLAQLFGIDEGEAIDAIAYEIQKRWPEAKDMSYFRGQERIHRSHAEQYESYRESIQRHALLDAATTLVKTLPVVRSRYGSENALTWVEWLKQYDTTFDSGVWLADQKDIAPKQAKEWIVNSYNGEDVFVDDETLLRKIGIITTLDEPFFPIYGSWRTTDSTHVRIVSALSPLKGSVNRCKAFSQRPRHNVWLPIFSSDGEAENYKSQNGFEPFIWLPEIYSDHIDSGDEFSTTGAAKRGRIGRDLTRKLKLQSDETLHEWYSASGDLALKSLVWGQWKRSTGDHRHWYQDDGMLLNANLTWLKSALASLNRHLVLCIDVNRHKSTYSDNSPELRSVYIALLQPDGTFRYWKAKT